MYITKEEAEELTNSIRSKLSDIVPLILKAWEARVWIPLGYSSWDEYCNIELGGWRPKLELTERKEKVMALREHGMSQRAIGLALNVGHNTVSRDLHDEISPVPNGTPHTIIAQDPLPSVTGTDGKVYQKPNKEIIENKMRNDPNANKTINEVENGKITANLASMVARGKEAYIAISNLTTRDDDINVEMTFYFKQIEQTVNALKEIIFVRNFSSELSELLGDE